MKAKKAQSTLEKTVTKNVRSAKAKQLRAERQAAAEEKAYQAKLPKTPEERAKIVWPSITDGKWDIYFAAGHWRLRFWVGKFEFQIHDDFVPADEGTPTEGYPATEAHWVKSLFVIPPDEYEHCLGYVGDLDDSWLAHRNDTGKEAEWYKKNMNEEIKKLNDRVTEMVQEFMSKKDDYSYREYLRRSSSR